MIKKALLAIIILIVCFMENISHLFGFCFHGLMSQGIAALAGGTVALGLYFRNIQMWLNTRTDEHPHQCKDHHNLEPHKREGEYDICRCSMTDMDIDTTNCKVHGGLSCKKN